MSDIGEFAPYGDDANDSTFSKATENFLPQGSGRHRSIIWNLPKSFPAFGKRRTHIRVSSWYVSKYEEGLIYQKEIEIS